MDDQARRLPTPRSMLAESQRDQALRLCSAADALAKNHEYDAALELYRRARTLLDGRDLRLSHAGSREQVLEQRQALATLLEHTLARSPSRFARYRRKLLPYLAGGFVCAGVQLTAHGMDYRDLTAGAKWLSSSATHGARRGVLPPRSWGFVEPDYFFHTNEENNPWIVVDLGEVHELRALEIVNRLDCCFERAARLRVETSLDGVRYQQVAQRQGSTNLRRRWRRAFAPHRARFIRISADGGPLHFADLRVYGT